MTGKILVFWIVGRLREVAAHGGSIDDNTVPTPGYIFLLGICSLYMRFIVIPAFPRILGRPLVREFMDVF